MMERKMRMTSVTTNMALETGSQRERRSWNVEPLFFPPFTTWHMLFKSPIVVAWIFAIFPLSTNFKIASENLSTKPSLSDWSFGKAYIQK